MNIEIYSKPSCSQCDQAKMLLKMKGLEFTSKMLGVDFTLEQLKEKVPVARMFPVVFIDDTYVGSLKELKDKI